MAQVSLKNVSGHGVHSFSLEVRDRELLVLAGPHACGARTVLRLIVGLDAVTDGEIVVGNKPVTDLAPKLRGAAMVFANGGLFPNWTLGQNIAFGLRGQHFPKSEVGKRVKQAAEVVGLDELERYPGKLSPLEILHTAWARAIVGQPKVILHEDANFVFPAAELVKLQERIQTTMIYATHDARTAMALGHRVALMEAGVLRQCDAPMAVYEKPENGFAAGFLGTMNFLTGKLKGALFKENGGTVELELHSDLAGREVILGVRPEDVRPSDAGCGQAVVDAVEATGAEVFYTLQTGGHALQVRCAASEPLRGVGRRMAFDIDPAKVHLFDAETKERL